MNQTVPIPHNARRRLKNWLYSERFAALLAGTFIAAGVMALQAVGLLEGAELAAFDRLLQWRPESEDRQDRIVVVEYTEEDIQDLEIGFPINDHTMARLLSTILAGEPRSVGVDFFRDIMLPPGSEELRAVLLGDPRVVMIHTGATEDEIGTPPPSFLIGTNQVGLADLVLDRDDAVRRAIVYQDDEEYGAELSLALQTSLAYLAPEGVAFGADPDNEYQLILGNTPLPRFEASDGGYSNIDNAGYQILIDWDGNLPFRGPSMGEVLRGEYDAANFRDKIVFLGTTATTHADLRIVPFGWWPGVFVHAHVASQFLRYGLSEDKPFTTTTDTQESLWITFWALLAAALGLWRRSAWIFGVCLLGGLGVVWGASYAALLSNLWLPPAAPSLAWLASASAVEAFLARREASERAALMSLFSRHVSKTVAAALWESRDQFLEGGRPLPRRAILSVLFMDIKSFTPVAEKLDPLEVMNWLNELMGTMTQETERHGGMVDDYFGDGLKADFGIPTPRHTEEEYDADASAAVRCALAMEQALERLNADWRKRDLPPGRLRIGIDTGEAVVGCLGSTDRMKYTVVGDTVNTSARIESMDDSSHDFEARRVRILVSERTFERVRDNFETRYAGEFSLKGKEKKVKVFEVLREVDSANAPAEGAMDAPL